MKNLLFPALLIIFLMTNKTHGMGYHGVLLLPIESRDYPELLKFSEALMLQKTDFIKPEICIWLEELKQFNSTIVLPRDSNTIAGLRFEANFELDHEGDWPMNIKILVEKLRKIYSRKKYSESEISTLLWCKISHLNVLYKEYWSVYPLCGFDSKFFDTVFPTNDTNYSVFLDSFHFCPVSPKYSNDSFLFQQLNTHYILNFISFLNLWDASFIRDKKHYFNFEQDFLEGIDAVRLTTMKELFRKTETGEYLLFYIQYSRGS